MWRLLVALSLSACGTPTPAPPIAKPAPIVVAPPPPAPPKIIGEPLQLIAAPPPPRVTKSCVTGATTATKRGKTYDFKPIALDGRSFGPRVENQPRAGYVRDAGSIRAAVAHQRDRLADCLRSAPGVRISVGTHTAPGVGVAVALTIDPHGLPTDVTVTGNAASLTSCVRESLLAIQVSGRTPRSTRVEGRIRFVHLPKLDQLVKRPPAPTPAALPSHCITTLDPLPVDKLELDDLGTVDMEPVRTRMHACVTYDFVDKRGVWAAVRSNLGSLRACAAAKPGVTGEVQVGLVFLVGEPQGVTVTGAGDDELHHCIQQAIEAISVPSMLTPITANLTFTLGAAPDQTDPEDARQLGDFDAAAARFADLARTAPSLDAGCRARTGLVDAYATAPWVVDERVLGAVDQLARFVAGHDRKALAACLADAAASLERIARWPVPPRAPLGFFRGDGLAEAVARSQDMVAKLPELEPALLPFIAEGLRILQRADDAMAVYLRVLQLGGDAEAIRRAADGYHEAATDRDHGYEIDSCELGHPE